MRIKTIKKIDQWLEWTLPQSLRDYVISGTGREEILATAALELALFEQNFGFFSLTHPIVGTVSNLAGDLNLVSCMLKELMLRDADPHFVEFAANELAAKALAYRDMKVGYEVAIPVMVEGVLSLELFTVDEVFDLWLGMPAFGLLSKKKGVSSILLFRGTDLSLGSQRGWASLMSDLDFKGPGLHTFLRAQPKLREWLNAAKSQHRSARAIGFSLGGAFAAYTFIYENDLLAPTGSVSFNAPGVSEKVVQDWMALSQSQQKGLINYINRGDSVSKVGILFGTVYQLSTTTQMKPFTAHTAVMSAQPQIVKMRVDVQKENSLR